MLPKGFFFHFCSWECLPIQALRLTGDEGAAIACRFKSPWFGTDGIVIEGKKYYLIREIEFGIMVVARLRSFGSVTMQATRSGMSTG